MFCFYYECTRYGYTFITNLILTLHHHLFLPFCLFFAFQNYQQKLRCSLSSLDNISNNSLRLPLWDKASAEFCFAKSRELLTKPFPSHCRVPYNSCCDLNEPPATKGFVHDFQSMSIQNGVDHMYRPPQYRDRTLTKSESLVRKSYAHPKRSGYPGCDAEYSNRFRAPNVYNDGTFYNNFGDIFVYENHSYIDEAGIYINNYDDLEMQSNSQENLQRRAVKTARERNLRRQSYNPQAYAEGSSSDSDCMSLGSVDLDWRRRRRLSRHSNSNSSIRSEMAARVRMSGQFLRPDIFVGGAVTKGRSPPPSNSMLSGLSPTTAARKRRSDSSSDSSL